jgi:hypothetical protein
MLTDRRPPLNTARQTIGILQTDLQIAVLFQIQDDRPLPVDAHKGVRIQRVSHASQQGGAPIGARLSSNFGWIVNAVST